MYRRTVSEFSSTLSGIRNFTFLYVRIQEWENQSKRTTSSTSSLVFFINHPCQRVLKSERRPLKTESTVVYYCTVQLTVIIINYPVNAILQCDTVRCARSLIRARARATCFEFGQATQLEASKCAQFSMWFSGSYSVQLSRTTTTGPLRTLGNGGNFTRLLVLKTSTSTWIHAPKIWNDESRVASE